MPVQCCAIWCIGAVSSALLRRDETGDTFAGPSECWLETGVAFARVGRASTETAIAFAGEKWVFLVRFSVALVMVVSAGAVQGRAVVMAVSLVSSGRRAVVSSVSTTCYQRRALVPAVSCGQCECVVMALNV